MRVGKKRERESYDKWGKGELHLSFCAKIDKKKKDRSGRALKRKKEKGGEGEGTSIPSQSLVPGGGRPNQGGKEKKKECTPLDKGGKKEKKKGYRIRKREKKGGGGALF